MQDDPPFTYSCVDFLFTFGGLLFFMLDIGLDAWAVVTFYQEEAYICLGLLLLFLLGSSVLAQVYSWLWYHYDDYKRQTRVEKCLSLFSLKSVHVFQMGIYLRYAGVAEVATRSFCTKKDDFGGLAVYLSHDLNMLRLIENFSESAPQLVLMLTVMLQRGQMEPFTLLKAAGSASAIACGVTMYHRSLRSFLLDKNKQTVPSFLIYFLWNLLLIAARIAAVALFASILPCFIFTHFLCSWMILFFFAWQSQTNFMDSPGGEWLYRATVALIWYFCWFNVVEGQTRFRSMLYHVWMMLDLGLLCGLWCWKMYTETPYFQLPQPHYAFIISSIIIAVYGIGLVLKGVYYKFYHPKIDERERKEGVSEESAAERELSLLSNGTDTVDHPDMAANGVDSLDRMAGPPEQVQKLENKRMRKLAENFYS